MFSSSFLYNTGSALACAAQSVQDGQLVVAQLAAHTSVPSNAPAASSSRALTTFGTHAARAPPLPTPTWHAPWELDTVVSGHLGWVRCLAMDPSNDFFATGSADRTIKVSMYSYIFTCLYVILGQ
ncbi:hypothetical protein EON64_07495 [archaeon]|nr:MAG: hypothetical protein EON64_07495 [archaeon]